jgi:hypothetical protein
VKNLSAAAILFLSSILHAGIKTEKPPSIEDYLAVEHTIETPPAVEAPKMDLGLKGMADDRPETRSPASVAEEVRANQGRLNALYKSWRLKGKAVERYFGVSLTIGPEGDVLKVAANGISNPEFKAELETAIRSWSFTRVREKRPMRANLKHLDFLYRNELSLN